MGRVWDLVSPMAGHAVPDDLVPGQAAEPDTLCSRHHNLGLRGYLHLQISPVGDADIFQFSGTAAETVLLTLSDVGGGGSFSEAKADIYDPNAQLLTTLQIDNGGTTWQDTLLETGTYMVVVTEAGNNQTVNYRLALQRLFPAPASAMTLCIDCMVQDGINPIADSDVVLFDGDAGETVLLTLSGCRRRV